MRVLLLFPPQCRPAHPHLALPLLKTALEDRGHYCRVVDLNMDIYDAILNRQELIASADRIRDQVKELDGLAKLEGADAIMFARKAESLLRSGFVIANIAEARRIFHSEDFYDYARLRFATKVIDDALELFSASYGSFKLGYSELRSCYSTASPSDLLAAASNSAENPFIEMLPRLLAPYLTDFQPDMVGLSIALDEQLLPSVTLAKHLRQVWQGTIVAGGSMVSRIHDRLLTDSEFGHLFDYWLPYDSIDRFITLVDSIGSVQPSTAPIASPESGLPMPDFSDLDLDRYFLPTRMLPFMTSMGCSYARCRYCAHHQTYGRFAVFPISRSAEQLAYLSKHYNCRYFYFVDESLEPGPARQLATELKNRDTDIRFMVFGRLSAGWTTQTVENFSAAGCRRLIFGLDSTSQRVLDLMNKRTDLCHASQVFADCAKRGIALQLNVIVGFPGETEVEALATLNFLRDNYSTLSKVTGSNVAFSEFILVHGADWREMDLDPVIDPEQSLAVNYAYRPRSGMTPNKIAELARLLSEEADAILNASACFPLKREFALLYSDRYGNHLPPVSDFNGPLQDISVYWFYHDIEHLLHQVHSIRQSLQLCPEDYRSDWWQLCREPHATPIISITRQSPSPYQYVTAMVGTQVVGAVISMA